MAEAATDGGRAAAEKAESGDSNSLIHEIAGPLRLTPEQRERLERISADSRDQAAIIRAELAAARADLKSLLDEDEPGFAAVMGQIDEVGAIETRMRKHQVATLLALRAVLSSDQREGLAGVLKAIAARDAAKPEAAGPRASRAVPAGAGASSNASTVSKADAEATDATP